MISKPRNNLYYAVIALVLGYGVAIPQTVLVNIVPVETRVNVDSIAVVSVYLSGVGGLHGYSVRLAYDTSVVKCRAIRKRNFFGLTTFFYSAIDSNAGRIQVDEAILGPYTRGGSGFLFEVEFRGRRNGSSQIQFLASDLRDSVNSQIAHLTEGGRVIVGLAQGAREQVLPDNYALTTYPNPFNASTTISFMLPRTAAAELRVVDLQGREVENLLSASMNAGTHIVRWQARDKASGTYFCRLVSEGRTVMRKILLLK